mgnify:FL=1
MIEFKNIDSKEDTFTFGEPLTFTEANDMLLHSINRYKIKGVKSKIGYKIVDSETNEPLFNSRIIINGDIESLFNIINQNKSIHEDIKNYVRDVENGIIQESNSSKLSEISNKQKEKIENLREKKGQLVEELRNQGQQASERELEHQEQLSRLQSEIEQIEQMVQLKNSEEEKMNEERIQQIKALQEQRKQIEQQAIQKREEEKQKRERHEKILAELEAEIQETEAELISLDEEVQMAELERKQRRAVLEEQKRNLERNKELTMSQNELEDAKLESVIVPPQTMAQPFPSISVDVPHIVEEEQNKYKIALNKAIDITKKVSRYTYIKGKRALRNHRSYRAKKRTLDEQLQKAKMEFLEEIEKDKKNRERQITRAERKRLKEQASLKRKEERYLKEIKKNQPSFSLRKLFNIAIICLVAYLIIDFFVNKELSHFTAIREKGKELYALIQSLFKI